jgi:rare lipoprotein A
VTNPVRLPRPFDGIVEGCLQLQPERRPSAGEIRQMLAPGSPASTQPRNEAPAASAAPIHYCRTPTAGNVWRALRILALAGLACLAVLLPFGWRKKEPASSGVPAAATAPSAPAGRAASAYAPLSRQAPTPLLVRAGYISCGMNGRRTASGERFDSNALAAATRAYPIGTCLLVTNLGNGASVVVRVNDRDRRRRFIGLTERAARDLGIARAGTAQVMLAVQK